MTLTLARPEGNPGGGKGLALFYLELHDAQGQPNGLRILRLKEKLGTRMLPTAEIELDGAVAVPVSGLSDGVRAIAPMLQITRTWNALCAVGGMRRVLPWRATTPGGARRSAPRSRRRRCTCRPWPTSRWRHRRPSFSPSGWSSCWAWWSRGRAGSPSASCCGRCSRW